MSGVQVLYGRPAYKIMTVSLSVNVYVYVSVYVYMCAAVTTITSD